MDRSSGEKIQSNLDEKTISGFGDEWKRLPQHDLGKKQRQLIFDDYFAIFPWSLLPKDAIGIDVGCGSGRWAQVMAKKVKHLHLLDASADALEVAKYNLSQYENVSFHNTSIESMQFENNLSWDEVQSYLRELKHALENSDLVELQRILIESVEGYSPESEV